MSFTSCVRLVCTYPCYNVKAKFSSYSLLQMLSFSKYGFTEYMWGHIDMRSGQGVRVCLFELAERKSTDESYCGHFVSALHWIKTDSTHIYLFTTRFPLASTDSHRI